MSGRCVIITGATSGIGVKTAEYLCEAGDNVILAARNEDRGKLILEKIKSKNPQALVHFLPLDLGSRESIEKFVEEFRALGKKLTVLINNAAILMGFKDTKRQFTKDGFELTLGNNYFGAWLLTHLLLEDLKQTAASDAQDARIINVVCNAHDHTTARRHNLRELNVDDILLCEQGAFTGGQAYKDSKAALIMFTYELARQLDGTNVSVNAICPGFVPATQLYRSCPVAQRYFNKWIMGGMLRFLKAVTTVDKAAEALFELADDAKYKGVTGKYYKEKKECEPSEECRNEEKQKAVWTKTGGYWQLDGFEALEIPPPPPEPETEVKKEEEAGEGKVEDGEKEKPDDEKGGDESKEEEKLVVEEKEPEEKMEKIEESVEK